MGQLVSEQEVQFYDVAVPDWPGEIDFYRALANEVKERGGSVLEVGCGTGRVTNQLAQEGISIVGMDISPAMLRIARQKSQALHHVRWMEGDMTSFDLGERFDLIIIPGHSFQFMLTPEDQLSCLDCIRQHLAPHGRLVLHINHDDLIWLGELAQGRGTDFKLKGEYRQEATQGLVRAWTAWSYEAGTQTATAINTWEYIGEDGHVQERKESAPKRLHVAFPFEMKHLIARAGLMTEAVYGDFFQHELQNTSPDMIWVARIEQS